MSSKSKFSFNSFIEECRKRKIFKGLSIYALVSWIIIQVAATTFPYLGIPRNAVTFIIIMVLIGLPLSLVFSWYYNVVPDENKGKETIEIEEEKIDEKSSRNTFRAFILLLSLAVVITVGLLIRNIFSDEKKKGGIESGLERIAVIEFENDTGEERFDILGKAVSNWISHGIVENKLATVISTEVVESYSNVVLEASTAGSSKIMSEFLSPSKIISGNIFYDNHNLIFKCTVRKGNTNETIFAFEDVITDEKDPLIGIEKLKERVLGYLVTDESPGLKLQDEPPIYEAYVQILESSKLEVTSDEWLEKVERAIEIDSNYFEAKVLRIAHYYNLGDFEFADSLVNTIVPNPNSFRQTNLLNFYKSLLSGKNASVYETWKNEFENAPFSLVDNSTMMVIALQFVYKPEEIHELYDIIDMSAMNIENCLQCRNRIFVNSIADLELKEYKPVIRRLKPLVKVNVTNDIIEPLLAAYIRSSDFKALDNLWEKIPNILLEESWQELYYFTAKELLLVNENGRAERFLDAAQKYYLESSNASSLAEIHMMQEEFDKAKGILDRYSQQTALSKKNKAHLAVCNYKTGDETKALQIEQEINEDRQKYDIGESDYYLAYIKAWTGKDDESILFLKKAVKQGYIFSWREFHNNFAFKSVRNHPNYNEVLKYWH